MAVGILHPGRMGAAVASCINGEVLWCSQGRSPATRRRAEEAGLSAVGELSSLVESSETIISVCPPAAAMDMARQVHELGYEGLYADLNAVAPDTSRQMGDLFARYVDGGIIGPPPEAPTSSTRLYLSGQAADEVEGLFTGSHLEARVIGAEPGLASALKAAYAGWTKGSSALLLAVAGYALSEGVEEALIQEWAISLPGLADRLERTSSTVTAKAWRFVGEMEEIAAAFQAAGLPDGFHLAAAEIFHRLAQLRDEVGSQSPGEVPRVLLGD